MGEIAAVIGPWVAIVALALGIANTISQWVSKPGKDLAFKLDGVIDDLKKHDRRIQSLEETDKYLPTKEDLHRVEIKMTDLTATMTGLKETVARMDRHLLERGQ